MVAALAKKVASRPKFSLNIPPRELIPLHVARSVPAAAAAASVAATTAAAASARQHCRTLSVSSISNASAPVSARSQVASPYRGTGGSYHQPASMQTSQASQPALPFRASLICPRLYVGNAVDAAALPALRAHNIRYVLNVAAECADTPAAAALEADGVQVLHVPLRDTADAAADALREFPRICQFIDAGLRDPRGAAVLVHCLYGVSRSATAALAYLLAASSAAAANARAAAAAAAPTPAAPTFSALPVSPVQPLATSTCDRGTIGKQDSDSKMEAARDDSDEGAVYAALHAMQAARPDVQPNDGFIGALIEWRSQCSHAQSRM